VVFALAQSGTEKVVGYIYACSEQVEDGRDGEIWPFSKAHYAQKEVWLPSTHYFMRLLIDWRILASQWRKTANPWPFALME
jgi:hypothetical protein